MNILKILIFAHIYIILLYPQSDEFIFEDLTIENGLSSNRVTSLLQDSKGFIWIGTEDGLNRFDGYNFKKYLNKRGDKNSISNNYVWSLSEDKNGNIWIATNGGGLNKFDPVYEKFYYYRFDEEDTTSISLDIVKCVYTDKKGDIWAGTWGGGLNLYNSESNSFIRFKNHPGNSSLSSNKIWCMYEDSKNNFWIGTSEGGLNLFDRKNRTFKCYLPNTTSLKSFRGTSAVTICEDSKGNLWIGTHGNGINRYNYSTGIFTNYSADGSDGSVSGNIIWKIFEDNQGLLWIATQGNGFNIFNYNSNKFKRIVLDSSNPQDPSSNNVKDIFEDRSSVLWIGMFTSGIKKINRKPSQFSSLKKIPNNPNSLPENFIYTMCEDAYGDIWIGTYSSLIRYLPLKGSFINYPVNQPGKNAVSGQRVRYIYRDSHNDIWIGTYFGKLNKYERSTDSFKKYSLAFNNNASENSNVRVIYEDSNGYLWIGTNGNGLIKYDRLNNKYKIFDTKSSEISGDIILSLIEDNKENLWIGTFGRGLNRYSIDNDRFAHFKSDPNDELSLSDNSITELYIDSKENLWIGTFSGGLCRYDFNENNFKTYKEIDGLAGNYVSGILEDDHYNLWISTSKGISRFSLEDSTSNKFKNYNFTQGLQKGEFIPGARLKTKNNIMYFGGVNGINYFHPDSLVNASNISPVVITSFKIQNSEANLIKNIVYTDTILLNHDQNFFSFEFASLDYTYPEKNLYSYILKGVDKDWNYSGSRRFASYTHLDPGEYEFKVKGTNSEGIWNEAGASVILIISPPFWGTWWFRTLMILIFLSIGPMIYFRRVTTLKKEKIATEEFSRRLIHSQEEERKRIASELHDSLGQELLIIKNRASLGLAKNDKDILITQMKEISNTASNSIDVVRQIAYNLHPYQIDRLGLTKAILSILDQVKSLTSIEVKESIEDVDSLFSKEDEINIFRIIQECINNIIKHSKANKLEIIIHKEENFFIKIADNGTGFDFEKVKQTGKGFGMKNLFKRTNILNGTMTMNSSVGKGTEIYIIIPLKKNDG